EQIGRRQAKRKRSVRPKYRATLSTFPGRVSARGSALKHDHGKDGSEDGETRSGQMLPAFPNGPPDVDREDHRTVDQVASPKPSRVGGEPVSPFEAQSPQPSRRTL